jgi:hypothetical protein
VFRSVVLYENFNRITRSAHLQLKVTPDYNNVLVMNEDVYYTCYRSRFSATGVLSHSYLSEASCLRSVLDQPSCVNTECDKTSAAKNSCCCSIGPSVVVGTLVAKEANRAQAFSVF